MVNAGEPGFFAFFSSLSTSERLKIPEKFMKHINDGTTGPIVLIGPSGSSWHVDLIQGDDGLFLCHGWPEFARDHFLESGDLLVFRYDGELHFTVEVFDQSACKKEYVFNSECSQEPCEFDKNDRQKREREADVVSSTGIFEGVPKRLRGSSAVFYPKCRDINADAHLSDKEGCRNEEVITTITLQEENYSRETHQYGSLVKIYSAPLQSKDCSGKPEAGVKKKPGREESSNMRGCYLSVLPENEEKRVAQSFTSSFPIFVRVMKRFNISGSYTLNIPYKFSMAHLPTCKTEIVLRNLKGACWTVNSVPTTRVHTSHTFCGGWMSFVRDNDIKMEDICVFELVYKSEFRVHILRVGKEEPDTLSEKQALHGVNVGCAATWYKTSDGLLNKVRKTSSKFHAKCLKKVGSCDKSRSNKGQESSSPNHTRKHGSAIKKSAAEEAIERGNSMETELGSRAGGGSRIVMARDEEKAAKTFASGFPHFVRIMRKFNVSGSYTLKIPRKFSAAHLPNCKSEIVIRNSKGEHWTVNSVPDSKGRMVNTFCGGWMAFVRGNDLKEGDVCIFELVNTCEMRVHISGVEKILLDLQCGNK